VFCLAHGDIAEAANVLAPNYNGREGCLCTEKKRIFAWSVLQIISSSSVDNQTYGYWIANSA